MNVTNKITITFSKIIAVQSFFHLHPLILKAKAELAAARSINKDSGNEEKEEKEGKEE